MTICLKHSATTGRPGLAFYVPTPPSTMSPIATSNANDTKVTCHCGQSTCPDYKAAA